MTFPATRADALARLEAFLPRAGRAYAATRNDDAGPGVAGSTSRLSPAIQALGLLIGFLALLVGVAASIGGEMLTTLSRAPSQQAGYRQ